MRNESESSWNGNSSFLRPEMNWFEVVSEESQLQTCSLKGLEVEDWNSIRIGREMELRRLWRRSRRAIENSLSNFFKMHFLVGNIANWASGAFIRLPMYPVYIIISKILLLHATGHLSRCRPASGGICSPTGAWVYKQYFFLHFSPLMNLLQNLVNPNWACRVVWFILRPSRARIAVAASSGSE